MQSYEPRSTRLVRIQPRPDTVYISQDRTVLSTDLNGFIEPGSPNGLFVGETRMLSCYRLTINGADPVRIVNSNVKQHSWLGYYIAQPRAIAESDNSQIRFQKDDGSGQVPPESQHSLEVRVSRFAGGGLHEDIDLKNFLGHRIQVTLELQIDADFADQFEVGYKRLQNGHLSKSWNRLDGDGWELHFKYHAENHYQHQGNEGLATLDLGFRYQIFNFSSPPSHDGDRVCFTIELDPQETWHTCVNMVPELDTHDVPPRYSCYSFGESDNHYDEMRESFLNSSTLFTTPESSTMSSTVIGALEQAKRDLASLRLHDLDQSEHEWTMAAGLPIYIALFGRDTLTTAWQSSMVTTEMIRGTLPVLKNTQGTGVNAWRDEEPGRMIHEAHTGPVSRLNFYPRARYYGSTTTALTYPFLVASLWHWTGNRAMVEPYIEPALKALAWAEKFGDRDEDGFYDYQTMSEQGTVNQGWKDSEDAIVFSDGHRAQTPIAMSEEQAFIYLSKLHFGETLWWLGRKAEARALVRQARELKKRFNAKFWMPDKGFLAMALDKDGRQVDSIASHAGHCIASGIVDKSLVQPIADRLLKPDMFSGWGIRTLSADHPAYNPYSYHCGSVWPVENGTFAIGYVRYGLHQQAETICKAFFESTRLFDFYRPPEVFSGHHRDDRHPFPALYPRSNTPQAWSASAVFCCVQALLGLYPYAPLKMLFIDPHLPDWLPDLTVSQLRVGEATVSLRFFRTASGRTDYTVLNQTGSLHVVRQPSPWSQTAGAGERLQGLWETALR